MPNVSQVYSANSNWLKAGVFVEAGVENAVMMIQNATVEDTRDFHGNPKKAIVLTLQGREEKKWELNATNSKLIAAIYGDATEGWIGKQIGIRLVRGVRFPFGVADILEAYNPQEQPQPANGHAVAAAAPASQPESPPVEPEPVGSGDDDLPF